jgi:ubiquinone biosynthesis protein UbiJ
MSELLFMSQEHVDVMNALLQDAPTVEAACAALGGPRTLTYDLAGGPDGGAVTWTMRLDRTVQFSLDRADDADVVFSGDWTRMIQATKGGRSGEAVDPGLTVSGDLQLVAQVGAVLDVARQVAAVPVTFPEV